MPFTLPLPLRRLRVLAALLLACVLAALVLSISPARASAQPAPDASSSPAVAQSFGYSGSVQTYTVPAGVNSLQVSATGGSGTGYYHADGGAGGTVNATIPATPGQTLDIYVGGNGGTPNGTAPPAATTAAAARAAVPAAEAAPTTSQAAPTTPPTPPAAALASPSRP